MNHLTADQIGKIRQQLLLEKKDLTKHLESDNRFGLASSLGENTGELSSYDNHPGDLATELYEREKDVALLESAEHQLDQIQIALERIEKGKYGLCFYCHEPIPYERLEAIPTTMYCINHVPDPNVSARRPVEEQVLAPPFDRTSLDERDDQNQFDGEDAWQIVESWGNSNTPAMAEDREVTSYDDMYVEADENDGYVETFESFLATDMFGSHVSVVRNKAYKEYIQGGEGEALLEPEYLEDLE